MLYEELRRKENIVLRQEKNERYVLYQLKKKEVKELELELEYFNIGVGFVDEGENYTCDFLKLVILCGNINEIKELHVRDLIPLMIVHRTKPTEKFEKLERIAEYPCYSSSKLSTIVHEDKLSSFKCACKKLQTDYFVVLKEINYEIPSRLGIMHQIGNQHPTIVTTKEIKQEVQDVIYGAIDHIKSEDYGDM